MHGREDVALGRRGVGALAGGVGPPESPLVARAVQRAKEGDRDALAFLYVRYADDIHGYVRSIVRDEHLAQDVTQQVFTKLIAVIGKYQDRGISFFAWLLRVARNVAVDELRRRDPIPVAEVLLGDGPTLRETVAHERARDLQDALATLPFAQREVLVLRHFAGLSPTEIAEHTGRTEASVHGLHHRGRRDLAAELASRGAAPATALVRQGGERMEL